ncbi:glutathione-dependent formaldehyde-activating enzyme [Colletotrichum incanum]|uniref:Glutathione-dependent formaldehyde-activating enzyme n=1 Tax=Colletotrichum incanum TaxID=1573173 RepID=A0A162NVN2_COLIC|nr:glutathione-dependent formaldehyde-activating enzyme [Colletotrichum incanum]
MQHGSLSFASWLHVLSIDASDDGRTRDVVARAPIEEAASTKAARCQTCQCTQCRRTKGSLFMPIHRVAKSALSFIPGTGSRDVENARATPPTLKSYRATPSAERCFCAACGSFLFWRSEDEADIDLAVGCIDPEFLFGEERRARDGNGGDGTKKSRNEGFGRALAGARTHVWCANEVAGVTDRMLRGKKMQRDTQHGVVLYED